MQRCHAYAVRIIPSYQGPNSPSHGRPFKSNHSLIARQTHGTEGTDPYSPVYPSLAHPYLPHKRQSPLPPLMPTGSFSSPQVRLESRIHPRPYTVCISLLNCPRGCAGNMKPQYQRSLQQKLQENAPQYGLSDVTFRSFQLNRGWSRVASDLTAADAVSAVTALLESPGKPDEPRSNATRFWCVPCARY